MLQHFLTQILQHATTHVNHIPEIMEIIYQTSSIRAGV